ncbi:hypothetical protein CEK00_13645 [Stenotrophomonas maltophilia]|uniref:Uncharacterized protein n=1 Tax=Stenotrophomonas maltophilia TaxID=40324 RepID=A0A270NE88_STEMA|nr:hypothetical protein CEK00_13645 [Stenotrophomonas maltophilia]
MAGGTGGPYDVGVSRSWPIFSVAAATTFTACSGLVVRAFPLIPAPAARPLEQQGGFSPETWLRAPGIARRRGACANQGWHLPVRCAARGRIPSQRDGL